MENKNSIKKGERKIKTGMLLFISMALLFAYIAGVNALTIAKDGQFKGKMDKVRVYDRVLTEEEVKVHYYFNYKKYSPGQWDFYAKQNLEHGIHTYQAFALDGAANSGHSEIRTIIINNKPITSEPLITSEYGKNYTTEDLICTSQSTYDEDGDPVIDIARWYKKAGEILEEQEELRGMAIISSGNTTIGERWACSMTPFDSMEYGDEKFSVNMTIRCVDEDEDEYCDSGEPEWCIGDNQDNVPADTECAEWKLNESGCHEKEILHPPGTVIEVKDCTSNIRWGDPTGCWDFAHINTICVEEGELIEGNCNVTYVCGPDSDINITECAGKFGKNWKDYYATCHDDGDTGCWDENVAKWHPYEDTACCGDDTEYEGKGYDECWVDDTGTAGCCWGEYITDPDHDARFCNEAGIIKGLENQGICDKEEEIYCYATVLGDVSQDPDCCCCGDDEGETWSVFSTAKNLKDIIITGRCQEGKWVNRSGVDLTLYDLWTSITP